MELRAAREQRLGDDDVGAGGERAVAEADLLLLEHRRDLLVEMLAAHDLRVERHVAAEMERARRAERVEPGGVAALRGEDQAELAQRRGMVLPGPRRERDGLGEGGAGLVFAVEQQQRLGAGGGAVIGRFGLVRIARRSARAPAPARVSAPVTRRRPAATGWRR